MNKKIFYITIALLVIASMVLTACGNAKPKGPVTLTIWHNWGPDDAKGAPLQSIFADFMAANPDIIIADEVYVDADIPLKVETASAANQEPDIAFTGRIGSAFGWTDSGITIPVNDLMTQWGLDGKFTDGALVEYTQADGKIQAFPLEGYTWPIWFDTGVFERAGVPVPTTTDELIAAAQAIRAAGDQPVIASGIDDMGGYLFSLVLESAMSDAEAIQAFRDGDWTVPNAIKGVEIFVQLRDAGVFVDGVEGIDYATANTQFFAGTVAMSHFGAWAFGEAPTELLPKIQVGGFPLPAGSPRQAPVYFSGFGAKGVWITPNGETKIEAVKKFVQFLFQPEMIARFVEQAGMTPPLKDVPVDATKLNPLFAQSLNMSAEVAIQPDLTMPGELRPDYLRITQEAFTPGTTAEKILADLTALYQTIK